MTKNFLGASLSHWLLLNPTAETQGNGKPVAPAKTPDASGKPVANLGLSAVDLIDQIEADPNAFATEPDEDEEEGSSQNAETQKAEKAKADAAAKAKTEADAAAAKKAEDDKAAAGAKPVELTADQQAWLELRAAAKTPEEAAEIDKQAPAFTDEEWAQVETGQVSREEAKEAKADDATGQLTAAQAEAAKFKTEAEAASKRLAEVEAELVRAKAQPVAIAPMNPLLMADATQLDQAEAAAVQMKEWALKHWDGSAAVEAQGNQPAQPAYPAEQVRAAYARADKHLASIIPAARQYLADHMAQNVTAKTVYPEIFNASSPDHQATESILQRLPGLRTALPSIKMVMGDALLGEKIRGLIYAEELTPETKALAAALVKAVPSLTKFMPALTAPGATPAKNNLKLPAKPVVPLARPGSAGGRIQRPGSGKPTGTPNVSRFVTQRTENGGDELSALTETLRNVNVG